MQHRTPRQVARLALLALGLGALGGAGAGPDKSAETIETADGNYATLVAQIQRQGLRNTLQNLETAPQQQARQPAEPRLAELLVRHRRMAGTVLLGDLPAGDGGSAFDHRVRLVHNTPDPVREH